MNKKIPMALSFDDILIRPQFSNVISRKQVSIKSKLDKFYNLLLPVNKKYQKGTLSFKNKSYPITLRLKGDFTDHIEGSQWSLRVQLKDNYVYGMKTFSLNML